MIKKISGKIFRKQNIGTLLLFLAFLLCFIFVRTPFFRAKIKDWDQSAPVEGMTIGGTYCTVDKEKLTGFSLAKVPGKGKQAGKVPERRCVKLLQTKNVDGEPWVCVEFAGIQGWMTADKISLVSEEDLTVQKGTKIYVDVHDLENASLYESPAWDTSPLAENIPYGTEFTVSEVYNGWGKISYEGKEGWISLFFTSLYASDQWMVDPLEEDAAWVDIKKNREDEAKTVQKIPKNTVVTVKTFKNGWGKVSYHNKTGWVKLENMLPQGSQKVKSVLHRTHPS